MGNECCLRLSRRLWEGMKNELPYHYGYFSFFFNEICFILRTDRQCHLLTQMYAMKQNEKTDHYGSKKKRMAPVTMIIG